MTEQVSIISDLTITEYYKLYIYFPATYAIEILAFVLLNNSYPTHPFLGFVLSLNLATYTHWDQKDLHAEKEPHGVRRADCAGNGSARNGLMRHQHTLTHTHTQMQALTPTPKHLFRVFLSSLETKELELLKT